MQLTDKISRLNSKRSRSHVGSALLLMVAPVVTAVFLLIATSGGLGSSRSFDFLVPWILGLALVMAIPLLILYRRGQFWLADPLVFATLTYFVPAFVFGGLFFALGWSQPSFQTLILDPSFNLPFTVVIIALGYSGLAAGYLLPISEKIGKKIKTVLPESDHPTWAYFLPGVFLIGIGVSFLVLAFSLGVLGYQIADSSTAYDGLIQITTLYWTMASFLLWLLIFRQKDHPPYIVPIFFILIATSLGKILVSGGRGAILQIVTMILLAFILSGRRFRLKEVAATGIILSFALLIGMVYGTTFRAVKGTERQVGADQYVEAIFDTFKEIERRDLSESITYGLTNFVERVDVLSTVAVVVSNYEHLKPFEEQYGIDNNIWIDLTTFFIPRVFWPEKPSASDARRYSDLYFNYAESSYSITPMGDLIRNFGISGVFLGMFVFGVVIRVIYAALIDRNKPVIWKLTLYFMLISTISYEAFYGTMIPTMVKIGFMSIIGLLFANYIAGRISFNHKNAETIG